MAAKKVFISYSIADKVVVDSFVKELKNHGIDYWDDEEIKIGEEWMNKIEAALYSASVYVLFISPNFLASNWSMFEAGVALGRFRQSEAVIVPVILSPTHLPEFLQNFRYIDASSLQHSDIVAKIQSIIEKK